MKRKDCCIVRPYSEIFDRYSNIFVFLRTTGSLFRFRFQNYLLLTENLAKYIVGHMEKYCISISNHMETSSNAHALVISINVIPPINNTIRHVCKVVKEEQTSDIDVVT
jgi:hypothetical protein